MSVKHAKHVTAPDVPGYDVVFSDWNADHVGSPVTVTDGTTTVPDVTTVTFPAGSVSGSAGSVAVAFPTVLDGGTP